MKIDEFKAEIDRFLRRSDPEVLCISGKWGVGKTFAWKKYLLEARAQPNGIALSKYAYVSLFGLGNLTDIKQAIFENTVDRINIGVDANLDTFENAIKGISSRWRAGSGFARISGSISKYSALLDKLSFLSIRGEIICIDDLERRSKNVDVRDILGLISFLKEQRKCKLVVLLNDEKLGDDYSEFQSQLEKVADTSIKFEPNPEDAAKIGISPGWRWADYLTESCVKLGIVNIRTIKKIESICFRLEEILAEFDERVVRQAIHSAALFGFSKYQPDIAPELSFIRKYNPYIGILSKDNDLIDHPDWRELISNYEFITLDEFDDIILLGIDSGHFDLEKLVSMAAVLEKKVLAGDDSQVFGDAWNLLRDSFADNDDEVLHALSEAIRTKPKAITPLDLAATVAVLKDLGWSGDVRALIEGYVAGRSEPRGFWDLAANPFGGEVRDLDVRAAFEAKLAEFKNDVDFKTTLLSVGGRSGWTPEELDFLASQSVEQYEKVFKGVRGKELTAAIAGGLMFANMTNGTASMNAITERSVEALRRIAARSPLNLKRVRLRGVAVPNPTNDQP